MAKAYAFWFGGTVREVDDREFNVKPHCWCGYPSGHQGLHGALDREVKDYFRGYSFAGYPKGAPTVRIIDYPSRQRRWVSHTVVWYNPLTWGRGYWIVNI